MFIFIPHKLSFILIILFVSHVVLSIMFIIGVLVSVLPLFSVWVGLVTLLLPGWCTCERSFCLMKYTSSDMLSKKKNIGISVPVHDCFMKGIPHLLRL